jgi:hypothetical protein
MTNKFPNLQVNMAQPKYSKEQTAIPILNLLQKIANLCYHQSQSTYSISQFNF